MKNRIQSGEVLDFANITGALILGGSLVVFGALAGIAVADIADGETGAVALTGVYNLPKAAGAITQGAKVYWDATNKVVTTTASGNTLFGTCAEAVLTGATSVNVLLVQNV